MVARAMPCHPTCLLVPDQCWAPTAQLKSQRQEPGQWWLAVRPGVSVLLALLACVSFTCPTFEDVGVQYSAVQHSMLYASCCRLPLLHHYLWLRLAGTVHTCYYGAACVGPGSRGSLHGESMRLARCAGRCYITCELHTIKGRGVDGNCQKCTPAPSPMHAALLCMPPQANNASSSH